MTKYTLERTGKRPLRFDGEIIAEAANSDNRACGSDGSGQAGRWQELSLYKTTSGMFVCAKVDYTRWQGEFDYYEAQVCETHEEIMEFFDYSRLALELYESAGIECAEDVN